MTSTLPLVRPAHTGDVPAVLGLIRDLAEYERALHEVHATEDQLRSCLFGADPKVFCHVAEVDGQVVGFAMWFLNFSTWLGAHGVYLEDLYVRPEMRGRRIGGALLRELAQLCVARGYPRLDWSVLDWNVDARGFYDGIGARAQTEWVPYRLTGAALAAFAKGA